MVVIGTSIAAVVGAVVMNLFKRPEEPEDDYVVKPAAAAAPKKSSKKKKAKKAKKAAAAPVPVEAEVEEEEEEEEEEPEPEPEPVPAPVAKKAKKKKGKKGGAAAAPPAAPAAAKVEAAPAKDEKKKKKKDKKKGGDAAAAAAAPVAPKAKAKPVEDDDDGWEVVPIASKASKKPTVVVPDAGEDGKTRMQINVAGHKPAIIGAKGAVIQSIVARSGARVDLGKDKSDNTCTISGTADEVQRAAEMVKAIIKERDDFQATQVEETVEVPEDRVPAIIGKGGAKIKELQAESGAKINIERGANVVTLMGTVVEVQLARELIKNVVNPPEPQYEASTVMNLSQHPMGTRAVSVIVGPKGETIRRIEKQTQAKLDIERGSAIMSIKGTQDAVVAALQEVSAVLGMHNKEVVIAVPDAASVGAILGRAGATIRKVEMDSKAKLKLEDDEEGNKTLKIQGSTEQITAAQKMIQGILSGDPIKPTPGDGEVVEEINCPASAVGAIIGRGGAEIKSIQETTGARVEIPRGSPLCWVVGTKKAVAEATKLIKAKVEATMQQEAERADRARQMAENAAKTQEQFGQGQDAAPDADDATWGQSKNSEGDWGGW